MKYFTKEWMDLNNRTAFHTLLSADKRCAEYSDEFFESLYNDEMNRYIDIQRELYESMDLYDGFGESTLPDEDNKAAFDPEEEKQNFLKTYEKTLGILEEALPEDIKKDVADLRVLALYRATKDVIAKIEKFCEDNLKAVKKVKREYAEYFMKIAYLVPKEFRENFQLNGAKVLDVQTHDNLYVITLDGYGDENEFSDVTFIDYEIIKDENIVGCHWLFDEIYPNNDGSVFEIHSLLYNEDTEKTAELILKAKDFMFM